MSTMKTRRQGSVPVLHTDPWNRPWLPQTQLGQVPAAPLNMSHTPHTSLVHYTTLCLGILCNVTMELFLGWWLWFTHNWYDPEQFYLLSRIHVLSAFSALLSFCVPPWNFPHPAQHSVLGTQVHHCQQGLSRGPVVLSGCTCRDLCMHKSDIW